MSEQEEIKNNFFEKYENAKSYSPQYWDCDKCRTLRNFYLGSPHIEKFGYRTGAYVAYWTCPVCGHKKGNFVSSENFEL